MFIPDPGSEFFPISDPGSQKHGEVKKCFLNLFSHLFVAFPFCWNRSWLITVAHFAFFSFFNPRKIGFKLSEVMVGSGIRDLEKTYSGSRIQGSKRYRIPDPDPQHWFLVFSLYAKFHSPYSFYEFNFFPRIIGKRTMSLNVLYANAKFFWDQSLIPCIISVRLTSFRILSV